MTHPIQHLVDARTHELLREDGYMVVPLEATDAMCAAARCHDPRGVWRDMISAWRCQVESERRTRV